MGELTENSTAGNSTDGNSTDGNSTTDASECPPVERERDGNGDHSLPGTGMEGLAGARIARSGAVH